jgi:hypothetical protein
MAPSPVFCTTASLRATPATAKAWPIIPWMPAFSWATAAASNDSSTAAHASL